MCKCKKNLWKLTNMKQKKICLALSYIIFFKYNLILFNDLIYILINKEN